MDLDVTNYDRSRYENKIDQESRVRLMLSSFMLGMVSMIEVYKLP
jgi:hypothetical protein